MSDKHLKDATAQAAEINAEMNRRKTLLSSKEIALEKAIERVTELKIEIADAKKELTKQRKVQKAMLNKLISSAASDPDLIDQLAKAATKLAGKEIPDASEENSSPAKTSKEASVDAYDQSNDEPVFESSSPASEEFERDNA